MNKPSTTPPERAWVPARAEPSMEQLVSTRQLDSRGTTTPGRAGRFLAGLAGACTVALVLLALIMLGALGLTAADEHPGPLLSTVIAHVLAAIVALVLQWFTDRYPGRTRTLCGWAVLVVFGVIIGLYWWF